MKIPKYVQEIMERSRFALGCGSPGYTLEIRKKTPYTTASAFHKEIERLVKWANRVSPYLPGVPNAVLNLVPKKTRHQYQFGYATIFDPVMKELEKYLR